MFQILPSRLGSGTNRKAQASTNAAISDMKNKGFTNRRERKGGPTLKDSTDVMNWKFPIIQRTVYSNETKFWSWMSSESDSLNFG